MSYRIAICDDEALEREKMEIYLERYSVEFNIDFSVDSYDSGEMLIKEYWKRKSPYHIVLLDMELGRMDGIDVAREIRLAPDYNVLIAYITSYPEYMQKSFDVQPTQYLMKPLGYELFKEKLTQMIELLSKFETNLLVIDQKDGEMLLDITEIQSIETVKKTSGRGRLKFTLLDSDVFANGTLSDFEDKLLQQGFARIHRTVLVNLRCIHKFQGERVVLKSGLELPLGRKYAKELRDSFSDFLVMHYRR